MAQKIDKTVLVKMDEAKEIYRAGSPDVAMSAYLTLLHELDYHPDLLTLAVDGLTDIGARDFALNLLIEAMQNTQPTEALLGSIGALAQQLGTHDIAIKIFRSALNLNGNQPSHYVNIANSQYLSGDTDTALETAQQALYMFPAYAPLWNMLGTIMLNGKHDYDNAKIFYQEAARLDPKSDVYLTNLANFFGNSPEGNKLYKKAVRLNNQNHEAHVGLAINYLAQGQLRKGWEHKEHRLLTDSLSSNKARPELPAPLWKGESLAGKSVFVIAEQGLGDEIFYSLALHQLAEVADSICISCDPRLVDIFQRTYPFAAVVGYQDSAKDGYLQRSFPKLDTLTSQPDVSIWAASLPKLFWPNIASIPNMADVSFRPCPALISKFSSQLNTPATETTCRRKLKVGLAWRSGNMGLGRSRAYFGVTLAGYIVRWFKDDIDFYNLQYGSNQEELATIAEIADSPIRVLEDVDLKEDIESNYAIISQLDALITPATATAMYGLTSNVPTYLVSTGPPWWAFGQENKTGPSYCPQFKWFFKGADERYGLTIRRMLNELKQNFDLETVF